MLTLYLYLLKTQKEVMTLSLLKLMKSHQLFYLLYRYNYI